MNDDFDINYDVVFRFLNRLYTDNKTMFEIIKSSNLEITKLNKEINNIFRDGFIKTASENEIRTYEKIFNIVSDLFLEDIEFRRDRIINRLSTSPPFTLPFLRQILNSILGEGHWSYDLDYNKYSIVIYSLIPGRNWLNEIKNTLESIIPAYMIWEIQLYMQSWQTVYENHKDWQEVYERYDGWQEVMEGIYK